MTPLRQRRLDDMRVRNFSPHTQRIYLDRVAKFAQYFGQSPDQLGPEEIRAYQVHLIREKKIGSSTLIQTVCALRFLYQVALQRDWDVTYCIPFPKKERKLPVILSPTEVARFTSVSVISIRLECLFASGKGKEGKIAL
jgi:integrase/recombinase XerD